MASSNQNEFLSKSRQSDNAAGEFCKLYYRTIDTKRQALYKMYMENARIIWNGNIINGLEEIKKFFENLPSSEHKVDSIDCQPFQDIQDSATNTILVTVCGASKFEKCKARIFNHSFLMTASNNVWKIVAENFRYHE